jgi:hypothetical protein
MFQARAYVRRATYIRNSDNTLLLQNLFFWATEGQCQGCAAKNWRESKLLRIATRALSEKVGVLFTTQGSAVIRIVEAFEEEGI